MRIITTASLTIGLLLFTAEGVTQDAAHGATEYKLCASCHGFKAEGNQLVHAPALAGQEDWYLERQIRNFRSGIRGSAEDDMHGKAMAMMTKGLDSDDKIADIVAYIGTLPAARLQSTVEGDTNAGRGHYTPCIACHGADATGNPALNAPALATIDDWYQLRQLQAFRNGHRGAHPQDTYGQQMAPMASVLPDDQALRDVVSYINSLR